MSTKLFLSRTVWTAIAMAAVNFAMQNSEQLRTIVPSKYVPIFDAGMLLLIAYFHAKPSQTYTTPPTADPGSV